jgi:tryptophan-rich sensory protein
MTVPAPVPFAVGWLWMGFCLGMAVLAALCWEQMTEEERYTRQGWAVLGLVALCVLLAFGCFLSTPEWAGSGCFSGN